jgi:two-component system, cell cycle response regulator
MAKDSYTVAVLGFNQTERIVLGSIFGLSARRVPKFLQHNPSQGGAPDMLLVDSSDPAAIQQLKSTNPNKTYPAILIGDWDHGTGFPVLSRPIQWTRLFKAFDIAVAAGGMPPPMNAQAAPAAIAAPVAPPAASPAPQAMVRSAVDITSSVESLPRATPMHDEPTVRLPQGFMNQKTEPLPPVARAAPAVPAPAASPTVARTAVPPAPPVRETSGGNTISPVPEAESADWVLVVDDNVTVREFMKSQLAPFAFNVDYAESGEQAVGMTGAKHYTCVFLDVVMPGIDGYQVCKLVKSKKSVKKTAVVMLTSKGSPFDKIRGAMAGCDAYLTKPVDVEKLLGVIAKFLPNG